MPKRTGIKTMLVILKCVKLLILKVGKKWFFDNCYRLYWESQIFNLLYFVITKKWKSPDWAIENSQWDSDLIRLVLETQKFGISDYSYAQR